MTLKKILIINLGWEQEPMIKQIITAGHRVYGIHNSSNFSFQSDFEDYIISDFRNLGAALEFALRIKPDAIISDECDYSHFLQAFLCESLNLPGPTIRQAQISSNKYLQRNLAKSLGLNVPNFTLVSSLEEASAAALRIGFPLIMKPIDNRGSYGVSKIKDIHDLKQAFIQAMIHSYSRLLLIEQFIEGTEYTVDGYCFFQVPTSLAVAIKSKENLNVQVSMDICYSEEVNSVLRNKLMDYNQVVCAKLGYNFGMTHSEYIVSNEGDIFLVEAANRGGGVFTSQIIVPYVSGVDILSLYIEECIYGIQNSKFDKNIYKIKQRSAILKFLNFQPGVIKHISGIDKIIAQNGILVVRLNVREMQKINEIDSDGSRHGFIIYGSEENDIRPRIKELLDQIQVTYE
jgi:biotin carboxylase